MVANHEPWIVAPSVLVAIQGAYVGLKIMFDLPGTGGARRRVLLARAVVTLAVAIWSMHLVGMLAVRSSARVDFLPLPTLVSFLVCVLVIGLAIFPASSGPYSKPLLAISAPAIGAVIGIMHLTGMMALHSNALMHHHLHRTHIVAIEHTSSPRRASDAGVTQLASATPYALSFPIAGGDA